MSKLNFELVIRENIVNLQRRIGRGNTGELSASVRRAYPSASLLHKRGPSLRKMSQNSFYGEEAFAILSSVQILEPICQFYIKLVNIEYSQLLFIGFPLTSCMGMSLPKQIPK